MTKLPAPILCLNAGSSSLKFAVFDLPGGEPVELARGAVERIGSPRAVLTIRAVSGPSPGAESCVVSEVGAAVPLVLGALARLGLNWGAVGHRIVHGGPNRVHPARVDEILLASLRAAIPFAPLHLPGQIALIEAIHRQDPGRLQVACFDTGFHARLPLISRRLPIPSSYWEAGVRRYGFHGLSYESVVESLGAAVAGRLIIAHLGNGASMAALRDGEPLETTMGLTPSGGLVMGTRPGDLDPGVVLYLARAGELDASGLEELLDRRSGLLALSETSGDMQTLIAARPSDPRAELAVAAFCYSARKWIGALSAVLGGLDALVFTGGIGESSAPVREEICADLGYLGIELDPGRNSRSEELISADGSRCSVRVIHTDEERVVARHTAELAA